ncbi:hypothetical protein VZC37_11610 [Gordonia sp. LSe1-13]|uniref:Uncharacterized protein n=1 Tax=Gordonia sesuvii TaxID=3116777 RepID=A0ABU7MD14_9ACTN|nr:hypothetical protein [Gordonia sp. LSe1-13]
MTHQQPPGGQPPFGPGPGQGGHPPLHPGGPPMHGGPAHPYPQSHPYAQGQPPGWPPPVGYGPPYPPPRPPRRTGMIVGTVLGLITIVAVIASAVFLTVADDGAGSSADSAARDELVRTPGPPEGGATASTADESGIRTAMQAFVDAVNSRNVTRIQSSVCSAMRPQVTTPLDITGYVVLEDLTEITVTGDSAASTVTTHLELGNQRSSPKQNEESFAREDGTWYVCPGTELDIGT